MPCMIAGASDGMAPAWFDDEQRAAVGGDLLEALPLDAEPVLVDRVVEPAGDLAHVLGAAPLVDVGAARVARGRRRSSSLGTGTSAVEVAPVAVAGEVGGLRLRLAPFASSGPGAVAIEAEW